MKTILYTMASLLLLISCKSIEKLVEQGNYEEAFDLSLKKLQGKKNKKTKFVRALQRAYNLLNQQNQDKIQLYSQKDNPFYYDKIVEEYVILYKRQEKIKPLLPLVSKDGYKSKIKLHDYISKINIAKKEAARRHYEYGLSYLKANENIKENAKKAYHHFSKTKSYFNNYKNVQNLLNEAYHRGQTHILLTYVSNGNNLLYDHSLKILENINTKSLNTKWEKYYNYEPRDIEISKILTISINTIIPGKELVKSREYEKHKDVKDGITPVLDTNGKVVKDSTGNIIYTDRYITYQATVFEMEREKIATLSGKWNIQDINTGNIEYTFPISITNRFYDYKCDFVGDREALDNYTINRLSPNCRPFPSDTTMVEAMTKQLIEKIIISINQTKKDWALSE